MNVKISSNSLNRAIGLGKEDMAAVYQVLSSMSGLPPQQ
jgi:hypothetical protein